MPTPSAVLFLGRGSPMNAIEDNGAADAKEPQRFFNDTCQATSISMRSAIWG